MASDPRLHPEIDDASERLKALDPTRSFLVQAPAGSGKTELLMQRYLTLLNHEGVPAPESVLAITFTRKAASEMRNRVLEALQNAQRPAPAEEHKRLSWELARKVVERDRALGWGLLQNPERFEIRTVDSLCEKIANRTPLLAGLGRTPSIAGEFEPLYEEAAERTLLMLGDTNETIAEAVARVLRDQDNSFDRVQRLMVSLLQRRDQWLRILGRSDLHTEEERSRLRANLESSLHDAIQSELRGIRLTVARCMTATQIAGLLTHARYAANNVEEENTIARLRDLRGLPGSGIEDMGAWKGLRDLCLTRDGSFRARLDRGTGFPEPGAHKQSCSTLLEELSDSEFSNDLCAALKRLDLLPPPDYSDEQWESLLALFRVLPLSVANLRAVFAERGEVDHTEVALAAKAALGDEGHPTDLAFHLGYRIKHLLVDEFQDTSVSQTEMLERLIQAWSPDSDATLFVVGDPMQSIYSFREAEVTLFLRAKLRGFGEGEWPLDCAQLVNNFRSRPELVDWFNQVFPEILTEDNEVTGGVQYAPVQATKSADEQAGVQFLSAPHKDFAAEAAQVVEAVRGEMKTDASSIAILVRSRRHVAHIAPALRAAGIPFRAKQIDVLGERQTVRDLQALTNAMLNLANRTSWLALLRGPWCGLELADLWKLCRNGEDKAIWELLTARGNTLSSRAQAVLQRIVPPLKQAVAARGRVPLRVLVESLWVSLGGSAAACGAERDAKLRDAKTYFSLLQKIESSGEVDEKRLESEIENLFAEADTRPDIRVEIMTIHGAKGLQFDVVIVLGMNRQTDRNKTQLLNWRERVLGEHRELLMAPMDPVGTDSKETPIAKYITQLGQECAGEETKRLLYVAATRAKERLYLVTTMPRHDGKPEKGSLLSLLPAEAIAKFPEQPDPDLEEGTPKRVPVVSRRLAADWRMPETPAPLRFERHFPSTADMEGKKHTFVRVGEELRRIGTVTHRILQQIGEDGVDAWNAKRVLGLAPVIRALLLQEGIRGDELVAAERRVRESLLRTLADSQGQWILKKRQAANNEFALTARLDGARTGIKVDRTFLEGETRWLIDYKTSDREGTITDSYLREQVEKYRADLEHYAKILRSFDGRAVKGGLYFPLLQRWCEVDLPS